MARTRQPAASGDSRWQRQWRAGRRWALWGALLGLGLGLVTQAPATWLAQGLLQASDGRLLLAEARGTVWSGSAVPVLQGGAGSRDAAALPGRLHWQLRPTLAGLALHLQQDCCLPAGAALLLKPVAGGLAVQLPPPQAGAPGAPPRAGAPSAPPLAGAPLAPPLATAPLAQWPAAWLAGLGTPWNTLQLGGRLQLRSDGFTLHTGGGQLRLDGMLLVQLDDASSRMSALPVLGSYRLQLSGQPGDGTRLVLSTRDGALLLNGEGQFTARGLRFRGTAQAAPGQDAALDNLLRIIGRRQGALSVITFG